MTTPQLDDPNEALGFDVDPEINNQEQTDSSCDIGIRRTRDSISGVCAALVVCALAAAIPNKAQALPPYQPAEDHSGVLDLRSFEAPRKKLNIRELANMPWSDVMVQLNSMETNDILDLMASLLPVLNDIKVISHEDINKKLRDEKLRNAQPKKKVLEDSEKEILLDMTEKYSSEDYEIVSSILKKEFLSERDCHFLFLTFRKIVGGQERTLSLYINLREWIAVERGKDLGNGRLAYLKQMLILLKGFKNNLSFE